MTAPTNIDALLERLEEMERHEQSAREAVYATNENTDWNTACQLSNDYEAACVAYTAELKKTLPRLAAEIRRQRLMTRWPDDFETGYKHALAVVKYCNDLPAAIDAMETELAANVEQPLISECPYCSLPVKAALFPVGVTALRDQVAALTAERDSLAAELRRLRGAERERDAAQAALDHNLGLANATTRHVMQERDKMIRTLRKTYSAIQISEMVGLTRQRVHQILNEPDLARSSTGEVKP